MEIHINQAIFVWLLNPKVPTISSKKLFHPWTGLFKALKKLSECTYREQRIEGRRQRQVVHFNRLKPFPRDIGSNRSSPEQPPAQPIGTNLEIVDD